MGELERDRHRCGRGRVTVSIAAAIAAAAAAAALPLIRSLLPFVSLMPFIFLSTPQKRSDETGLQIWAKRPAARSARGGQGRGSGGSLSEAGAKWR